MSADRENHDMTQTDIALLLAGATDEVEIGTAPVQAVMRGGRRRRARRWAVAAATAVVVLTGSAGATLAFAGRPGEHRTQVATQVRDVARPQVTELAHGTDHGKRWRVVVSVWQAPRDRTEAARQREAMQSYGIDGSALPGLTRLVGRTSFYASLYYGDAPLRPVIFNTVDKWEKFAGADLESGAVHLAEEDAEGRLVVGMVATSVGQVRCTWKSGAATVAVPRAAAGSPVDWFVCVAPDGTGYADAKAITSR
ncbi:hypothetical protein AB5J52_13935 [Streptomyces sp. R39]|uniref:Tat pathway signal sequence domain protein n=1 Tax=Streptomyces sp. R39 TaxID=3238631 RepID=A0AB39QLJ1_9ACTN